MKNPICRQRSLNYSRKHTKNESKSYFLKVYGEMFRPQEYTLYFCNLLYYNRQKDKQIDR